jgi:hypothetical protein
MTKLREATFHLSAVALFATFACGNDSIALNNTNGGGGGGGGGGGDPLPAQGQLFRSDWSTAVGTTDGALGDGGKWNNQICSGDLRRRVLSVVPGSSAGWTATPNVLQVTNRGGVNCGMVEVTNAVPPGTNFYIRMYIRVEDENQITFHSIDLNAVGAIQAPLWSIFDPVERVDYNPKFTIETPESQFRRWRPRTKLRQGTWYRFEWQVEFVSTAARTARIWPRIYDMQGTLLFDASGYVGIDQSGSTLQQYYDRGGTARFTDLDLARRFGLGYEGTAGANDTGRKWFYAGVEIRSDTWPGPIR